MVNRQPIIELDEVLYLDQRQLGCESLKLEQGVLFYHQVSKANLLLLVYLVVN